MHNALREYWEDLQYLPAAGAPTYPLCRRIQIEGGAFPSYGLFGSLFCCSATATSGNRVSGVKWGIVRIPHAVTGPNETNLNQQNITNSNPTGVRALGFKGEGVSFLTAPVYIKFLGKWVDQLLCYY